MSRTLPGHAGPTAMLQRQLGPVVSTLDAERFRVSFDASKLSFMPDAVVGVESSSHIAATLALANEFRVPVTVRGGGTSLTGSASPSRGGWVLDLSKLNRIRIDAENGMAFAEAGAIVAKVQEAAKRRGWFYPPDPASMKFCTIGGTVACNAGGMHGLSYGVTRDHVLALEGFLPTGEKVRWGRPLFKYSAGFNLRDLWIGSEGMLGVITNVVLRLLPLPPIRFMIAAAFPSDIDALRAARKLLAARIHPSVCEFIGRNCMRCLDRVTYNMRAFSHYRPLLLVELSGERLEVKDRAAFLRQWASTGALAWEEAKVVGRAEEFWTARRRVSGSLAALGKGKLNQDIVLPRRSYSAFSRYLVSLEKESGLPLPFFGHVGDGNFHVNVIYNPDNSRSCRKAETTVCKLMKKVVALGGAISGEHGIGLTKSGFLGLEHTKTEIAAMKSVKRALDPNGILNPGKMFEPFDLVQHRRIKTSMPWDSA